MPQKPHGCGCPTGWQIQRLSHRQVRCVPGADQPAPRGWEQGTVPHALTLFSGKLSSQPVPEEACPGVLHPEGCLQYSNHAATFTSAWGARPFLPPAGKSRLPERPCALNKAGSRGLKVSWRWDCSLPMPLPSPKPSPHFSRVSGTLARSSCDPRSPLGSSNLQNRNCRAAVGGWDFQQIGKDSSRPAGRFLQDHPPLGRKRGKKGKSLSSCFCFS